MTAQKIVKKLSMKHLVGNVKAFIPTKEVEEKRGDKTVVKEIPAIGETKWLAQVVGIARGTKHGTSNFGDWSALVGDFIAVPLEGDKKGQRFRTGQIFLPDVVQTMVEAALGGNTGVDFAFKIGITAASTEGERPSATGYEYTADFLIEPEKSDPLTALAEKALPAPTETEESPNETEGNETEGNETAKSGRTAKQTA